MAAVAQETLVGSLDTARLYERHYRRVLSYCLWRLGKREDAEDAAQTTFLNAHRALSGGTTPESESSWLLTIANNVCLARWRSQKCRPPEVAAEPEALAAHAAPEHDHELVGHLQAALAGLPEVQRRAFVLREWQGSPTPRSPRSSRRPRPLSRRSSFGPGARSRRCSPTSARQAARES